MQQGSSIASTRQWERPFNPIPTAFNTASFAVQNRKNRCHSSSLPNRHSLGSAILSSRPRDRGWIGSISMPSGAEPATPATKAGLWATDQCHPFDGSGTLSLFLVRRPSRPPARRADCRAAARARRLSARTFRRPVQVRILSGTARITGWRTTCVACLCIAYEASSPC